MQHQKRILSSSITAIKQHFYRERFARNVLVMMTGTSLAQAISIGIAPILTRIYTPTDYGIFALYSSICALISVISTGRYDAAAMLPEEDDDAANLVALSFSITVIIAFITLLIITLFNQAIIELVGNGEIGPFLYFVPASVLLTGLYQGLYYWSNRRRLFKRLSVGKICGSLIGSTTTLGMGVASLGVSGLVIGGLSGQAVSGAVLSAQLWERNRTKVVVSVSRISLLARRYYKFPLFSLSSDFVNVAAQQIPILLLNNFFGSSVVGFFSLTQRVLGLPFSLIANSILDVFRQRASSDYVAQGNCRNIFNKTFKYLFFLSIIPFALFFITAPYLFTFIFGKSWTVAGEYAQILTPLFWLRFISSPLSYVLYVAEKQHVDLGGQILLLIFSVSSMYIGYAYDNPKISIKCFSLSYMFVYIYYLALSYKYSRS